MSLAMSSRENADPFEVLSCFQSKKKLAELVNDRNRKPLRVIVCLK